MKQLPVLHIHTLIVGQLATNCYIVYHAHDITKGAWIIDPGDDAEYIIDTIESLHVKPHAIVATHGHFDHILGAFALQKTYGIPFYIHRRDEFLVQSMGESAKHFLGFTPDPPPLISGYLSSRHGVLTIVHTPGHTPGSVSVYIPTANTILTGDTIFARGGVGRTDHSYSSKADLEDSVARILRNPQQSVILPGHGESSSVQKELTYYV